MAYRALVERARGWVFWVLSILCIAFLIFSVSSHMKPVSSLSGEFLPKFGCPAGGITIPRLYPPSPLSLCGQTPGANPTSGSPTSPRYEADPFP